MAARYTFLLTEQHTVPEQTAAQKAKKTPADTNQRGFLKKSRILPIMVGGSGAPHSTQILPTIA
jgi:hypothetical protein